MKKLSKIILCVLIVCSLMAFASISRSYSITKPLTELKTKPIEMVEVCLEPELELEIVVKGHNQFLEAIGHRESGNRYEIVNKYGYMGKYQFGASTLKGLGFKVTKDQFLNSPYIQEQAMQSLLLHNRKKLRKFIEEYDGKVVHGVLITESGVLAAAHLAGAGNVKKFFRKGKVFEDGFGTKMTSYMTLFNGYRLNLDGV